VQKTDTAKKIDQLLAKVDGMYLLFNILESVPAVLLAKADNRLEAYIAKTRILLEREQEFISQRTHDDNEIKTAHSLREENERLQLLYSEAQETAIKMEDALGGMISSVFKYIQCWGINSLLEDQYPEIN
jgi:hypothetical protein